MASGVLRPYTLVDVLGTLNQQSQQQTGTTISGLSGFAEADESATVGDAVTASAQTPPGWDQTTWGAAVWA